MTEFFSWFLSASHTLPASPTSLPVPLQLAPTATESHQAPTTPLPAHRYRHRPYPRPRLRFIARQHRMLQRPGVHETGEGRMRALHRIKPGYYTIFPVIAKHGPDLRIHTEGPCVPECCCPGNPPAHIAHHHVQERGAVAPDRVEWVSARAGQADLIHLRGRVKDPEGEPPHHAAVGPAAATAFVDQPCSPVRQGPGSHQIKE